MWLGLFQWVLLLWGFNEELKAMHYPRFEVLTVVLLRIQLSWSVMLCRVSCCRHFKGSKCLHLNCKQFKNKLFVLGLLFPEDEGNTILCSARRHTPSDMVSHPWHSNSQPCSRILKDSLKLLSSCTLCCPDRRNIARHGDTYSLHIVLWVQNWHSYLHKLWAHHVAKKY